LFPTHNDLAGLQGGGANEFFHLNSNDYSNRNVSATSVYQLLANSSNSLGTTYTSHTHSQYLNTSQSSLFQQTSLMSDYLGTAATQSFRFTSNDSQLLFTSQSSLFQQTSATSAITSNAFPSSQTTKFAGTGTTLNGTNVSLSATLDSIGLRLDASVAAPGAASLNVSAGTTSANLTALTFADGSGVSFGLNAGTITATVRTDYQSSGNYLTTARASNDAVGLNTALTGNGVSWTVNSSGISLNVPAFLTTAMQSNQSSNFVNTSQSSLFLQTSATSAITSNALHTSVSTRFAGTGTTTAGTNISLSMTLNSVGLNLAASVNAGGGGGIALANSQTTYTSGTAHLSAAGALTIQSTTGQSYQFSVPATSSLSGTGHLSISANGSTISLGVPSPAVSGTNGSFSYSTLSFGNINGISFYTTNGSLVASYTTASAAPSPVIISAGTSSASLGSIVFSNSNGVSFGLSGSTITANAGAAPRSFYNPYGDLMMVAGQVGQGTLNINPNVMPAMTFDRVLMPINNTNAANSSGSHTLSFWLGIYTLNVSTLSLVTSNSVTYALTHSGNAGSYSLYSGMRHISIPMSTSLSEGRDYLGVLSRTTSGGANGSYAQFQVSNLASSFLGLFGSSHATTMQFQPGIGVYSVTTSGIPGTIQINQLRGSDTGAQRPPIVIFANSTL